MKRIFCCVVALAAVSLLGFAPAAVAQASSARYEDREQEIRAVRAVYQEVTRAAAANRLARRDSTVNCRGDDLGMEVTLMTDSAGRVRQLTWRGGTEDHAEVNRFYYDGAGRLRFIFATRGAVNGTGQEERDYYAADGRLLRRSTTRTRGPGYPFSPATPIRRPMEWLRHVCPDPG
jgi:hypothetical protein